MTTLYDDILAELRRAGRPLTAHEIGEQLGIPSRRVLLEIACVSLGRNRPKRTEITRVGTVRTHAKGPPRKLWAAQAAV